jgi:CubicO group peptidase (beta-lactamase class C family)
MFRFVSLIARLAPLILLGCGESDSGSPAGGADPDDCADLQFHEVDTTLSAFLDSNGLTGASAVVVHEACGVVHARGYGAYASDRSYLVGSSSKVLSAGILLRLADEGLIDVDAAIGQYVPAWAASGKPELTVAQLLSNSSGLVGLVDRPFYAPYRCQYQEAGTLSACAESIYTANDAADRAPPDTSFHYGGGQWQLAGGIAEVVSGKSWAELVRETYAEPCEAPGLGYTNQFEAAANAGGALSALEYPAFFQGQPSNLPSTDNPNVEGGLFTTVQDYAKILLMHLSGGLCGTERVLSESAVRRMQLDRILEEYGGSTRGQSGRTAGGDADALLGYGLGWWIDRDEPGVVADPGLYGAFPWLDVPRGYGAFFALEADGNLGAELWLRLKPKLDALFDAQRL